MRIFKAAVLAAVTAVWTIGLASPAHAFTDITIDSPNGDEYQSGEDVTATGYNASDFTEEVEIDCTNAVRYRDVPTGLFEVSLGSFTGPQTCAVYDSFSYDLLATFTVAEPATTVSDASVNRETFYPTVRDGYQDAVTFRWRQSYKGHATITVRNSDGKHVRTASPRAASGRNNWTWNGKNNRGNTVAEGRYRIHVTVNSNSASAPVKVDSGIVTRTFRQRKEGNQGVRFATRGNCYATRDSYNQVAELDCWGGRYAKARYRFSIPSGAFSVQGTVDLISTDLNVCCDGKITRGWARTSKDTVALWAKVTGWRATEVNFVRVRYQAKVRI